MCNFEDDEPRPLSRGQRIAIGTVALVALVPIAMAIGLDRCDDPVEPLAPPPAATPAALAAPPDGAAPPPARQGETLLPAGVLAPEPREAAE